MAETDPEAARRQRAMLDAALTVALERLGGSITFTDEEYQAVRDRHGGAATNLRLEVVRGPGVPDAVRVTLEERRPEPGELVS